MRDLFCRLNIIMGFFSRNKFYLNDVFLVNLSVIIIFILQFVILPFLGDSYNAGKIYFFAFFVLISLFFLLYKKTFINISPLYFLFFLFFIVLEISAYQAQNQFEAFLSLSILLLYCLFLFVFYHFSIEQPLLQRRIIDALLVFGLLSALLGIYEYVHFLTVGPSVHPLIPNLLPPDRSVRIGGPYGQPNLFAVFLTVTLLAFFYKHLHFFLTDRSVKLPWLRFLAPFTVAVVFFQTGSRAGFLSFILVFSSLAWLVASHRFLGGNAEAKREFVRLLVCLLCAFAVQRYIAWVAGDLSAIRSLVDTGISADARFVFWASAFLIFLDNPWFGIGLENYGFVQDAYGPAAHSVLGFVPYEAMGNTDWAHNELLQILSEGGIIAFVLVVSLLGIFVWSIWRKLIKNQEPLGSLPLFGHLFLLPFIIQSMFSWPLRSPSLLILFFSLLGILLAQYPSKRYAFSKLGKILFCFLISTALFIGIGMFAKEVKIGSFKASLAATPPAAESLEKMRALVESPYGSYRVLSKALPGFTRRALAQKDEGLAARLISFYEKLVAMEGARWQWYALARLYHKVGQKDNARLAIQKAIDLMPSDEVTWAFLHYLNMLKASHETGKGIENFWPLGQEVDISALELIRE